jgi:predicted nucleotidyltransferase component of viral defense system
MKDYLRAQVQACTTAIQGRNVTRDYVQARILGVLQRAGAMVPLAFHGGTALRFLYAIPRYSEDLDFALERAPDTYDFRAYLQAIQAMFSREGYEVTLKVNDRKIVHNAFVRFAGLLHTLGLSPHEREVLAVKLEVDTHPPSGAGLTTTVVRHHALMQLQHHDRASLLAGKLHALLQRPYVKGRDVYDLLWYLSDPTWPTPNIAMLNNALAQTGWTGPRLTEEKWRATVKVRIAALDWARVVSDVRPFLEHEEDVAMLTRENVLRVLNMDDTYAASSGR